MPTLVAFLLQHLGNQALQSSLDGFFGALRGQGQALRAVTKSALCQARRKLKASAFTALNHLWVDGVHERSAFERWQGLRVVAADGTCLRVPNWHENVGSFGAGPCGDASVTMARCVGLLSVATGQFLDASLGAYGQGERELVMQSLGRLRADDVLVLDRGYPAWWLFGALQAKGLAYCARIDACGWPAAQRLMTSSAQEVTLEHKANAKQRRELALALEGELECPEVIKLRLIKVRLPSGKLQVLATSLTDAARYPAQVFSALYGQRWAIEEAFKTIKHRLHIEGWSGELPHAIEQDVAAKMWMHNVSQALCAQAQELVEPAKCEHYRVNHAYALRRLPAVVVAMLGKEIAALQHDIQMLVGLLAQTLEKVRPGRSFPRKHALGGAQRPRRAYP
jgi:hypothetical protein